MPTLARLTGRPSPASAHRERGQVLILFVMGATVIFLIGAIVVDIGLWVSERRNAQAAADLASLAAATQLHDPVDPNGAATAKGSEFAKRNGFDDADSNVDVWVTPDIPAETVKVEIDEQGVSLFAGIFGITSPHVGASAVAAYGASPPGPDVALFATSTDCISGRTLDIQAQHLRLTGSTHANADIYVDGPDDRFTGPITFVCPNGFSEGSQQNFSYQPRPRMISSQSPPMTVSWLDVPCSATVPAGTQIETVAGLWEGNNPSRGLLRPNIICSNGDLGLSGDGISGHVTLAAQGKLTILSTGSLGNRLQAADSLSAGPLANLLAFSAVDAINITANAGKYTGYIHAPNSRVVFNGAQDVELNGAIVAKTVLVSGSNIRFTALPGLAGPPGPPQVHLED